MSVFVSKSLNILGGKVLWCSVRKKGKGFSVIWNQCCPFLPINKVALNLKTCSWMPCNRGVLVGFASSAITLLAGEALPRVKRGAELAAGRSRAPFPSSPGDPFQPYHAAALQVAQGKYLWALGRKANIKMTMKIAQPVKTCSSQEQKSYLETLKSHLDGRDMHSRWRINGFHTMSSAEMPQHTSLCGFGRWNS